MNEKTKSFLSFVENMNNYELSSLSNSIKGKVSINKIEDFKNLLKPQEEKQILEISFSIFK